MVNTRGALACAAALVAGALPAGPARAQPQGFAVERLDQSAPGSGWWTLNDLAWPLGVGGAISLSLGYAHDPLRIRPEGGGPGLSLIEHQLFTSIGLAVSHHRFRLHASLSSPIYLAGQSGLVGDQQLTSPSVNLEQNPDTITDVHLALDARLLGDPASPLRLGASAELVFPSGDRADFSSDDTYRAAGRVLLAGEQGRFTYAGHLGLHVRPLNDPQVVQGPRGSELLFGAGAAIKVPFAQGSLQVGPEVFGATALRSWFGDNTSALEGLLSASLERSGLAAGRMRLKVGLGAGLHPRFGAPVWRAVVGLELIGQLVEPDANPSPAGRR